MSRVIAEGPDQIEVAKQAYARAGYVPIYVGLVTNEPPRPVRIPSPRLFPGRTRSVPGYPQVALHGLQVLHTVELPQFQKPGQVECRAVVQTAWSSQLARLPTASTTHAPPLRGPGPARPLAGTKAIRRAHFRLGHRAPGRGGRQARTVSGCLNSAFLGLFLDQLRSQLFREWIPNPTRRQHFLSSLEPFLAT